MIYLILFRISGGVLHSLPSGLVPNKILSAFENKKLLNKISAELCSGRVIPRSNPAGRPEITFYNMPTLITVPSPTDSNVLFGFGYYQN